MLEEKHLSYISSKEDKQLKSLSQEDLLRMMTNLEVKKLIEDYRSGDVEAKSKLPAVLFNGKFSEEKYQNYIAACKEKGIEPEKSKRKDIFMTPTGLLMLDFDHVPDPKGLLETIMIELEQRGLDSKAIIALAHITPSGQGLRLVVKRVKGRTIPQEQLWWDEVAGIECDKTCKNLGRLSFATSWVNVLNYNPLLLFTPIEDFPEDEEVRLENRKAKAIVEPVEYELDPLYDAQTLTYDDIPLGVLSKMMEIRLGGAPEEGCRHNFVLRMAAHLRWVADHDAKVMKQIIPTYNLPLCEYNRIIEDMAISQRYSTISPLMQSVVEESSEVVNEIAETDAQLDQEDKIIDPDILHLVNTFESTKIPAMPKVLPKPIELIINSLPEKTKAYGAVAIFPMLGLYLKNVKFEHFRDGGAEPTFLTMVLGLSSGGKNDINRIKDFLLEPIEEYTRESEDILREYQAKVLKLSKNDARPERPSNLRLQIVSDNMTEAGKLRALQQSAPYRLFVFTPEMERLYKMNDGKARDFWTDVCTCFDFGKTGQLRASAEAVNGRADFRINWIAHSTPRRFVNAIEYAGSITQGALSRINVIILPEEDDDFGEITIINDIDDSDKAILRNDIQKLETVTDCVIDCPEAKEWHIKQLKRFKNYAQAVNFINFKNLFFRATTMGFYKAMILWLMNDRQWTQEIEDFATWSVEFDLWSKLILFGSKIKEEFKKEIEVLEGKTGNSFLFNQLPNTFTVEDYVLVRKKIGFNTEETDTENIKKARKHLNKWVERRKIKRIGEASYAKI